MKCITWDSLKKATIQSWFTIGTQNSVSLHVRATIRTLQSLKICPPPTLLGGNIEAKCVLIQKRHVISSHKLSKLLGIYE